MEELHIGLLTVKRLFQLSIQKLGCRVESNEDITDRTTFYITGMKILQKASTISRSYTCRMAVLYKLRPKIHPFLKVACMTQLY